MASDALLRLSAGSTSTQSSFGVLAPEPARRRRPTPAQAQAPDTTVKAVYSYIRAVRALGRESVNTAEISRALSLRQSEVQRAVLALQGKGVKIRR